MSNTYLDNLASFPDIEVHAVGDLFPAAAQARAEQHGIHVAGDVSTVLDHPDIEIVVNLTIPAAHAEVANQAVTKGKHVWNEKPLALEAPSSEASWSRRACDRAARIGRASRSTRARATSPPV